MSNDYTASHREREHDIKHDIKAQQVIIKFWESRTSI